MKEFLDEIVKIVDDIEKMKLIEEVCLGYIIKKRPKRVCGECFNYHRYGPGEVMSLGPVNIEECRRGHTISLFAADSCPHFSSKNGFFRRLNDDRK